MQRAAEDEILKDLSKKMVFLVGPRQVGKTTLAKALMGRFRRPQYLNQDDWDDARVIRDRAWPRDTDLVVLDEIHKAPGWKSLLKGAFDTRPEGQAFLVTGSARLDTFRQSGESLAGRYYPHRLHPLSVRELSGRLAPWEALGSLMRFGGFPEPFLSGSEEEAARWRRQYYGDIIREDILEFSRVHELRAMRLLLDLLRRRVGSPLSIASLAEDLQLAPNTARRYLEILESLHIVFLVRPFHRNLARAVLKEPKLYFYDNGLVEGDEGARLENAVAACLLKHIQHEQDVRGRDVELGCVRTKDGKEVDFCLIEGGELKVLLEVKLSDAALSPRLAWFQRKFPEAQAFQLVHHLKREEERSGARVTSAAEWLARLAA